MDNFLGTECLNAITAVFAVLIAIVGLFLLTLQKTLEDLKIEFGGDVLDSGSIFRLEE